MEVSEKDKECKHRERKRKSPLESARKRPRRSRSNSETSTSSSYKLISTTTSSTSGSSSDTQSDLGNQKYREHRNKMPEAKKLHRRNKKKRKHKSRSGNRMQDKLSPVNCRSSVTRTESDSQKPDILPSTKSILEENPFNFCDSTDVKKENIGHITNLSPNDPQNNPNDQLSNKCEFPYNLKDVIEETDSEQTKILENHKLPYTMEDSSVTETYDFAQNVQNVQLNIDDKHSLEVCNKGLYKATIPSLAIPPPTNFYGHYSLERNINDTVPFVPPPMYPFPPPNYSVPFVHELTKTAEELKYERDVESFLRQTTERLNQGSTSSRDNQYYDKNGKRIYHPDDPRYQHQSRNRDNAGRTSSTKDISDITSTEGKDRDLRIEKDAPHTSARKPEIEMYNPEKFSTLDNEQKETDLSNRLSHGNVNCKTDMIDMTQKIEPKKGASYQHPLDEIGLLSEDMNLDELAER